MVCGKDGSLITFCIIFPYGASQTMLEFFRKYQRYFFLIVTVVIVISFSFFGTYSTLQDLNFREQVAFTAVDGSEVKRSELDELVMFLSTDSDDKLMFGGLWGPNFLNDGVVKKDFMQTGMAEILAAQFPAEIEPDLEARQAKEKRFALYSHPQAKFISTESAWTYFAPDLKSNYEILRNAANPLDSRAFSARVRLYVGEKRFPSQALRQVIRYQEKQYGWVAPDAALDRTDLSIFGYHTLEDWFGPRFIRIVAQFIINSSKTAQQQGYTVTKEEALADLIRNSDLSYQQNLSNPNLGVANSKEYFNEQLRRMGIDQTKAIKVWQQVLLFRRLFHDAGNSVFVDPNAFKGFNQYAKESVDGQVYQLPKDLQIGDYRTLQKLETYLNAVSKRGDDEKALLSLPTAFLSVEEVSKKNPELVQKRYLLDIAHISKNSLLVKVGIKETWNWEIEDKNWTALKKQFPELGVKKGDTREERLTALDSLDDKTRARVDAYARIAILEAHPEWIVQALQEADSKKGVIGLRLKDNSDQFIGLEDSQELIKLLDQAPLVNGKDATPESKVVAEKLDHFTADNTNYYRVLVVERSPNKEILTFAEANSKGVLDKLLDKELQAHYEKIRSVDTAQYQKADKSWKPLTDVRDAVADSYFAKLLKAVQSDFAKSNGSKDKLTGDSAASLRLYAHVRDIKDKIQKDPNAAMNLVDTDTSKPASDSLSQRDSLANQWKLESRELHVDRSSLNSRVNKAEAIALVPEQWSKVYTAANGDIFFFQKKASASKEDLALASEKIEKTRRLLSDDIQQTLMKKLLTDMKGKKAISLDYLNTKPEMTTEE